ncbi:MAG: hypothetical protein ABIS29_02620 [Vicinamibacterales bacterium]
MRRYSDFGWCAHTFKPTDCYLEATLSDLRSIEARRSTSPLQGIAVEAASQRPVFAKKSTDIAVSLHLATAPKSERAAREPSLIT